ncbi:MAG: alpha-1,2-fucosyltransferase [Caldimicrobium sp.]
MLIIRLQGGLGNQMFQYAFIKALSLKTNNEYRLDLSSFEEDKNFFIRFYRYKFKKYTKERYRLNVFEIDEKIANKEEVRRIIGDIDIIFLIKKKLKILKNNIYIEQFPPAYKELNIYDKKIMYFIGYFQDERYFIDIKDILKKEFIFKKEIINNFSENFFRWLKIIKNFSNSVGVHIRRGDYLKNEKAKKEWGVCSIKYYINAMRYFQFYKDVAFFIFSNDIHWCKTHFVPVLYSLGIKNVYVIEGCRSDLEEFELMRNCSHLIIANSTFSWWAAWLNNNPNKKIIVPSIWNFKALNWHPSLNLGWLKFDV